MSDLIKIAVAGAGLVGKRHAMTILHCKGVKLTAIADPDATTKKFAEECKITHYDSLQELLATDKPDGIVIASPNSSHVENGLQAVEAKCPMLIEKPLADSAEEAEILISAAAEAKVPVLVGHHRRHNPIIKKAKEIVESGVLGQLRAVQGTFWLYKPDEYFNEVPWRKKPGAGPIAVNLVHDIDLIRYLCGEVVQVQAQVAPSLRGYDNEDVAAALLLLEGGALATIQCSDTVVAPWSWELTAGENPAYPATDESCYMLGGTHASLSLPDLNLWQHKDKRGWWEPISATVPPCQGGDPLHHQILHFADVIAGKAEPLVSGEESRQNLRVLEAIKQAAESGKIVTLQCT